MSEKQLKNQAVADMPKRKMPVSPGRKRIIEGGYVRTTICLSRKDREKLKILGGSAWIREAIRKAEI